MTTEGQQGRRGEEKKWPAEEWMPCDWRTSAAVFLGFISPAAQSHTHIAEEALGFALSGICIHLHVLNLFLILGTFCLFLTLQL